MIERTRLSLRQLFGLMGSGGEWRRGGSLVLIGCAAYFLALLYPAPHLIKWYQVMSLIWFAGILLTSGALLLPSRPRIWLLVKLVIVAAAIHWTAALPIARWDWL